MKIGQTFYVTHEALLRPLVGRLVHLEVEGETVKARIMSIAPDHAKISVVPESTTESSWSV